MSKIVDREALRRRKWHMTNARRAVKAEKQKRMADIFGEGHAGKKVAELARLLKT